MFEKDIEELVGLTDDDLDARIRANEMERRRLDAELAAAVAVAERRQLHALDGHRSIAAYLRATLNYSTSEASRVRTLARAVDHVNGLGDAWSSGRFGRPQALQLAKLHANRRVRDHLALFVPLLLANAEELPHRDFVECVDRFVTSADADGAHVDRDEQIEHRDAVVTEVGGSLAIRAHGGDPLQTAEVIEIFSRFEQAEFRADLAARRAEHGDAADAQPLPRTARQRRHDALVAIFRAASTAEGVGSAADPLVNIVIDSRSWSRLLAASGLAPSTDLGGTPIDPFTGSADPRDLLDHLAIDTRARCETDRGQQLHPHDVLRAALAGHIRRVVVDADSTVIDHGRRTRCFTGSAREAALLLVKRCEHPGCELPAAMCQVDHAIEWSADGGTDQGNARVRCGLHNWQKHQQRWRSKRAPNGRTYTIRADGTVILPVGVRTPVLPIDDLDLDDDPAEIARIDEYTRQRLHRSYAS